MRKFLALIFLLINFEAFAQTYGSPTYQNIVLRSCLTGFVAASATNPLTSPVGCRQIKVVDLSSADFGAGVTTALSFPVNGANGLLTFGAASSGINFVQGGVGAVTRTAQTKLREIEVSLEDYLANGETTYDNAWARALAANPVAIAIMLQQGVTYNFSDTLTINRSNVQVKCKGFHGCTINFAHAKAGVTINVGTTTTINLTTTNGSPTATVPSATGLAVGMYISQANVPQGTTITNIVSNTLTLSNNAAASGVSSAIIGNKVYTIDFTDVTFTRSVVATSGCDIQARNAGFIGLRRVYFYSAGNSLSAFCGISVATVYIEEIIANNFRDAQILISGVSPSVSGFEGVSIDIHLDKGQFYYGHQATVNAIANKRGVIEFTQGTSGIFIRRPTIAQSPSYGVVFNGSSAPAGAVNALVFGEDINVECDHPGCSAILINNYSNVVLTHGWISGYSNPAIVTSGVSPGVNVTGINIAVNGSATFAVSCATTGLSLSGNNFVAYNSPQYAVGISPGCGLQLNGGLISQFNGGIFNNGATNANARVNVTGVNFEGTNSPIDSVVFSWAKTGFCGNSNNIGPMNCITNGLISQSPSLMTTIIPLSNGAAAAAGTLTNAPVAGNPTKWVPINDNGTTRYIPAW